MHSKKCVANRSRNNFAILTLFQDSRDIIFETTRDVSINGLAISIFIAASPKKKFWISILAIGPPKVCEIQQLFPEFLF